MRGALLQHDLLLRACIETHGGRVFKTVGDAFCAVFASPRSAVAAVLTSQQWLPALALDAAGGRIPLRVRMALHAGTAEERDGDYFGPPVNRVARLLAIAHGGQVLLSLTAATLVRDLLPAGASLLPLGEHSLKDLASPESVAQLLHPDLPADFPPLRSLEKAGPKHNLPQPLTRLVGRATEVRDWTALIRGRSRRLFTLTGFGGLGKTRMALRLAEGLVPDFPDGVWWCNLEHATGTQDAVTAMVRGLGLSLQPSVDVREQLFHHLKDRNTLLVLDNLEQVADASMLLRDLLTQTERVVFLITSRRTMDLRGEMVLEVPTLPEAESASLFAERAAEYRTDFALDDQNRKDVRELCRRLEGVPLAIELAAARVAGMTPQQILARLTERFRLLQSRSPDLSERQRALRGAIDWSYQLLSEDEKQVFAQLAAFSGGFTLDDAEAVCEAFDVFESVMSLRRQSLLRSGSPHGAQGECFVMLESLRDYAAERLEEVEGARESGGSVRDRHARHFLSHAQEKLLLLRTPREPQALDELAQSDRNLRAALDWAASVGDGLLFAQLSLVAGSSLHRRGFVQSAVEIVQAGLEATLLQAESHPSTAARLMLERAGLHYDFKDSEACARLAGSARPLFELVGDERGIAHVENLLGQAAMTQRRFPEALHHYERAQQLFQAAGDAIGVAIAMNNRGLAERRDQSGSSAEVAARRERAGEHLHSALQLRRRLDDRRGLAETLNNLGVLAFEWGEFDRAWAHYQEALTFERQVGNRLGIGVAMANLGEVAGILGRATEGARLLAASERVLQELGSSDTPWVRGELEKLAPVAGWSIENLREIRTGLHALSIEECCDWAMEQGLHSGLWTDPQREARATA